MADSAVCLECQRPFRHADGQLHPILDGILCPYCGAVTLFVVHLPSWESEQEALLDAQWQRRHHPPDDA